MSDRGRSDPLPARVAAQVFVVAILLLVVVIPAERRLGAAAAAALGERAEQAAAAGLEQAASRLAAIGLAEPDLAGPDRLAPAIVEAFAPAHHSIGDDGAVSVGPLAASPDPDTSCWLTFRLREGRPVIGVTAMGCAGRARATLEAEYPIVILRR